MRFFGSWSQILRRVCQLGSLFFIVYTAFGTPWRNYKMAYNNARLVGLSEGTFWATLYDANDRLLSWFGESAETSLSLLGMPWASTVVGVASVDPVLAIGNMAASRSVSLDILVAVVGPLLLAAIAGRFFCSHLCPARLTFEVGEFARRGLKRLDIPLLQYESNMKLGGWVLLGGAIASWFGGAVIWLFILPYVGLGATIYLAVAQQTLSVLIVSMVFWLVVDIFLAPGFFCKNVCPTGFALTWVGRFRTWRLATKKNPEACPTNCRACERICPYNISSRDGATDIGCDNCGRCVSVCPSSRLSRRFTKPIVVMLALLFSSVAMSDDAFAHHNKGLPHYGYFENYPQTPTEEYVVVQGRWEMGATIFNFQGYSLRETSDTPNDIKIYLYIYDLKKDENYRGKVDFTIRERGGDVIAETLRAEVDEEAVYSTRERLPHSGDYEIVAKFPDSDDEVVLPFYVDLNESYNWTLILGIGVPLSILIALAWVGRSRRRRRA